MVPNWVVAASLVSGFVEFWWFSSWVLFDC